MSTRTYQDLVVWQKAHYLVIKVYKATKLFPADERYTLVAQVRRSVASVAANIVEGYARNNNGIFLNHLGMAQGSLEETKYHLLVARDLGYISDKEYQQLLAAAEEVGRLLRAFMNNMRPKS